MQETQKGATTRAILLGLFLVPFNVYWLIIVEMKYRAEATALPIFIYPVFILFCLVVCNNGISKWWPSIRLSAGELLTVYAMLVISTSIASYGMLQDLFAVVVHPYRFATEENEWKNLFFRHIPPWFTVSQSDLLIGYYEGDSTLYERKHLEAWMRPMLVWSVFTLVLLFMIHCLNTLIRRQWVSAERLAFPIIQLPVTMTRAEHFFRNRMLWLGFAIPAILDLMNGLHVLYPPVPYFHLKLTYIDKYFTEKPWNAMGTTRISLYPFMIGLAFFLPVDLSFSCWFFFVLRQLSRVLSSYLGQSNLPGFPYFHEQSAGSWLCLCVIAVWVTRRHLGVVFRIAFSKTSVADAQEPMRYRTAIFGLVGGVLFMTLFCHHAGMSLVAILLFFSIYFAIAIAITRLRAEFGAPHGVFNQPLEMMVTCFGSMTWGARSLTVMSFFYWFNRSYRSHAMPNQFEALKMAEVANINTRRLIFGMMAASVLALICGVATHLDMLYRDGALARVPFFKLWVGSGTFRRLESWLYHPVPPDLPRIGFMGVGALLTVILFILRLRFFWWPLHPAGYALAVSFAIDYFWFTFFISWALKSIILKAGQVKGYQRAIPFFFGLILGDFVTGALWMVFGVLTQQQVYMIYLNGGTWY